jgi:hypothetical protein
MMVLTVRAMATCINRIFLAIAVLGFGSGAHLLYAQQPDSAGTGALQPALLLGWEAGVEAFAPSNEDRTISTINLNTALGLILIRDLRLYLYGGITATRAWGHIIQARDSTGDTTLESSATGAGGYFELRWEPFAFGPVAFRLNASPGIILYSTHFPAGGDIYNFMLRVGPDVVVRVGEKTYVALGYRWMHVSNGQGLGAFNPSYEGQGAGIALGWRF